MSVDRHLGCFHVLAVVNSAAVTPGVHVSFQAKVYLLLFQNMPRSRIVGSHGIPIFSFLKGPPCCFHGLPWWLSGKESTCQCRRPGFNSWVMKIPWRKKGQSTPVSLCDKSHRPRSLVGSSPWVSKE